MGSVEVGRACVQVAAVCVAAGAISVDSAAAVPSVVGAVFAGTAAAAFV